ncbi:MAG: hypothetical protein ABSB60_05395 [Terracidiphilus sp.]
MKLPLRSHVIFAAGLLCLASGSASGSGEPQQTDTQPLAPQQGVSAESSQRSLTANVVVIPGPLRPFLRMAGISQEASSDEVLPLLARNISLWGYEHDRPTEFLVLIDRYVRFARELQSLAGPEGYIRVASCDAAAPLIQILGYRFQEGCGPKGAYLVTENPKRAFLTIDSGFPLTELEEDLQKGTPFNFAFPATSVPILFSQKAWISLSAAQREDRTELLDILLHDRDVDRLYSALARNDRQTGLVLERSPGLRRLLPYAPLLDFYGSRICIRGGRVAVPGGASAEGIWKELVGASPDASGEFVTHLLTRDRGWLIAYFDALSRINPAQQAHFTDGNRLRRLYFAFRSVPRESSVTNAAAGVFPRNSGLMVLFSRLQWQPNGEAQIPGNLQIWQEILTHKSNTNGIRDWATSSRSWESPEKLLEALVASSALEAAADPLRIYLLLCAIDNGRSPENRLGDAAVRTIAGRFSEFNSWYPIFAEFPALDDSSIASFIQAAERIEKIPNPALRSNALGAFQADIGLWQILARQGQIEKPALNQSWLNAVHPFLTVTSSTQLFDGSRASLESTLQTASGNKHLSQDQVVDLLAGPPQNTPEGRRVHKELARRIRSVMDDQRLVSLDTLFGLYDGLDEMAHGKAVGDSLIPLAADLREFEMPRPIFTGMERASWSPVVYSARHAELQVRTDLTKTIRSPGPPAQFENARGLLTPFLRDTLVGFNYAYYEPPGAQVLHNNPLFVRSHDFSASSVQGVENVWSPPELIGIGVTAGGGAYLLGSLSDLPYALASMEQDFIAPEKIQALIWREVVPELLVVSVMPRWWDVDKDEMHAAALYQRFGEELLTASASNPQLKEKVLSILSDRLPSERLEQAQAALEQPDGATELVSQMMPADTYFLAAEFRSKFPEEASLWGSAGRDLDALIQRDPSHVNPERLARDFGTPHPALAQSNSNSLLNTGIFPFSGAFDGRLFGESWESSNLYWARLADERGYSPVMLNVLIPDLTKHMVANIFATDIDDWPALLRAMRETGDQFRQGKIAPYAAATTGQVDSSWVDVAANGNR